MVRPVNRTHDARFWFFLNIDNTVSEITPAEVDHIMNIEIVISQNGQYLTQNFRHVFVTEGNPVTPVSCHLSIRIIHRIPYVAID